MKVLKNIMEYWVVRHHVARQNGYYVKPLHPFVIRSIKLESQS